MTPVNDCWNRIGVRGDGSCPELSKHVHCRNCPVYSSAAVRLLDADASAADIAVSTAHFSARAVVTERDTRAVLIFRIDTEWLALPADLIEEITNLRTIRTLPHRSSGVILGIVGVRGELLICVSPGRVLSLGSSDGTARAGLKRLLVIRHDNLRIVCPVDEVHGVHRFHPQLLKDVPTTVARTAAGISKAVLPWREHSVGVLDAHLFMSAVQREIA